MARRRRWAVGAYGGDRRAIPMRQKAMTACNIGTQPVIPAVSGVMAPLKVPCLSGTPLRLIQSRSFGRRSHFSPAPYS